MSSQPANDEPSAEVIQSGLAEHASWLRAVVYARVGEPAAVEDVLQQIAAEATRNAATLNDPAKLGPWLYRIGVTVALQHRRRAGRRRKLIDRCAHATQPTEHDPRQPDPLDWLIAEEQRELVRRALAELSPRDAEALLLKHTQNWSYQQIADRLGVSRTAIEGRLHRARKKLRAKLASQIETEHESLPLHRRSRA